MFPFPKATFRRLMIIGLPVAGDIKFLISLGIVSMWLIATLLAYIFGISLGLGLCGVWIAMMLDECIRAIILYCRLRKGIWRNRALIKEISCLNNR